MCAQVNGEGWKTEDTCWTDEVRQDSGEKQTETGLTADGAKLYKYNLRVKVEVFIFMRFEEESKSKMLFYDPETF